MAKNKYESAVEAALNLEKLQQNPYPGRGIVMGRNTTDTATVQIYWIMGRSENSRNRVFEVDGERIFTEPADPSKVKDPSLIIYTAMDNMHGNYIVSNGDQTDTIIKAIGRGFDFYSALEAREYEPDGPNFTPRISGMYSQNGLKEFHFSVIRRSPWSVASDRLNYRYHMIEPGFGFYITTYLGDGEPLPAFCGEPILVRIGEDAESIANLYWETLNPDNRVSLAVKLIPDNDEPTVVKIINKHSKTE